MAKPGPHVTAAALHSSELLPGVTAVGMLCMSRATVAVCARERQRSQHIMACSIIKYAVSAILPAGGISGCMKLSCPCAVYQALYQTGCLHHVVTRCGAEQSQSVVYQVGNVWWRLGSVGVVCHGLLAAVVKHFQCQVVGLLRHVC
jgi:hypothetical protein